MAQPKPQAQPKLETPKPTGDGISEVRLRDAVAVAGRQPLPTLKAKDGLALAFHAHGVLVTLGAARVLVPFANITAVQFENGTA